MAAESNTSGVVVAAAAWLVACFIGGFDEEQDVASFVGGALVRAALTLALGAFVRWLYVRGHGGSVRSAELLWIAAAFAAFLAAGRLAF